MLTVESIQEFCLIAPQHPRNATKNMTIPVTKTIIAPPVCILEPKMPLCNYPTKWKWSLPAILPLRPIPKYN